MGRSIPYWLGLLLVAPWASGCGRAPDEPPPVEATWVGGETCAPCHQQQFSSWTGSDHDLAMQIADETTVLGDFDDATFTHFGVTSRFFRSNGKFFVNTDGPDGELHDFEIKYTFGVRPLQQYLIELPGGRLQALTLCWDSRPADEGGQRWYPLYPDEAIRHDDPLHWTGRNLNWNYMCAECHSTDLRKNYDLDNDRFETTWAEIDVSCEACHGPGSNHVAWAESATGIGHGDDTTLGLQVRLGDRGARWVMDPENGIARRSAPRSSRAQSETCARCHSRRSAAHDGYVHGRPLADTHRLSLLEPGLYHADGQILDEVYVYGSFLQSKMFREGVTCSDCHDPHSLAIHGSGNAVCAGCHLTAKYDSPSHHFHEMNTDAALCTSCHMPETTYMGVDPRADHSFRVPRPDLTGRIGTPNACNGCHVDKTAEWAADAIAEQRESVGGPRLEPHFGEVLHAGRQGSPGAQPRLARLATDPAQPAIVRATAAALLGSYLGPESVAALGLAVGDPDPRVRIAALDAADSADPQLRARLAAPLLDDPVRLVRVAAAGLLADVPSELMTPEQISALDFALGEYRETQLANAERPESHVNLGTLYGRLGDVELAERSFETAIRLDPGFVPAYVNYADLYRGQGRDAEGERLLRRAIEIAPDDGDVRHSLGLLLVRQKRYQEAVTELKRSVELSPDRARYAYVLGVALNDLGETDNAVVVLDRAHRRHPSDRDILYALAAIEAGRGNQSAALTYGRKLLELSPQDPVAQQLVQRLISP